MRAAERGPGARGSRALRVRLEAARLGPDHGLVHLESALARICSKSSVTLRSLEITGDVPRWDRRGWARGDGVRLSEWGGRLAAEASTSGSLRVGWADGIVRGPALELLLACDLLVLGPEARLVIFPPQDGYVPVAGGLTRAIRRAGPGAVLTACLEAEPVSAARATHLGLASAVVERGRLDGVLRHLAESDARATTAVADLARRVPGLGGRQAEALERAIFSWCFAGGHPPRAIRDYRGRDERHRRSMVPPEQETGDD